MLTILLTVRRAQMSGSAAGPTLTVTILTTFRNGRALVADHRLHINSMFGTHLRKK
jgi:hypothetical protein